VADSGRGEQAVLESADALTAVLVVAPYASRSVTKWWTSSRVGNPGPEPPTLLVILRYVSRGGCYLIARVPVTLRALKPG